MKTNELSLQTVRSAEPLRRERDHIDLELNTHAYSDYIASLYAPQDSALTEAISEMQREGIRMMNASLARTLPEEGTLVTDDCHYSGPAPSRLERPGIFN